MLLCSASPLLTSYCAAVGVTVMVSQDLSLRLVKFFIAMGQLWACLCKEVKYSPKLLPVFFVWVCFVLLNNSDGCKFLSSEDLSGASSFKSARSVA